MATWASLRFWKIFYGIPGGPPSGLLALCIAAWRDSVLAAKLIALLVCTFCTLVPLDAGASLRFMECRKRMIRGRMAVIADRHCLVVPDLGSDGKPQVG
jgi:hypothetical protein